MITNTKAVETPMVTIGMPVYNGAAYIREALDSVLAQTYNNYEVIISDNGSTDTTHEICMEYQKLDNRIRYIHHDMNRGGHWNFNYVTHNAKGSLITWLAHDDVLLPEFLHITVAEFLNNPTTVLVASDFQIIDDQGKEIYIERLTSIRNNISWHLRCVEFFKNPISNVFFSIYGLVAAEPCKLVMQSTSESRVATGSELPVLARLALMGEISSTPYVLRKYRKHSTSVYSTEMAQLANKSLLKRIIFDVSNLYRLRFKQIHILLTSKKPLSFKAFVLTRVFNFYGSVFLMRLKKYKLKILARLTGVQF